MHTHKKTQQQTNKPKQNNKKTPTHKKTPKPKTKPKNPNQNKKLFPPSMKIAKLYTKISILVVAG